MRFRNGLAVRGILFYVVLLGSFFAAPYANLYFLLLVFLTVIAAGDLWSSRRNVRGVAVHLDPFEPIPSGASGFATGWLDGGRRVRFGLEIVVAFRDRTELRWTIPVVEGRTPFSGDIPARARGRIDVQAVWLVSTWPFGFVRWRRRIAVADALIVYPAPVDDPLHAHGGGAGDRAGAAGGGPGFVQPAGVREYRPGDPPRRVHWRASARRGVPVVCEWESGTGSGREVVLDRRSDEETLERNLGVVSALAHASRDRKEVLTVHTQGSSTAYGESHRPWGALFEALALAAPLAAADGAPPPASPAVLRLGPPGVAQ